MQKGLAAAESVFGLIDEVPEPQDGQSIPGRVRGELEFRDVAFHYHAGEGAAVGGVSFRVAPGETLALVGPSGSGKSTVASLIPRFYELDEGHILLDGSDIGEMRLGDLRAQISLVSQDVLLFNDSVAANIAYGARAASDRAAIESAAKAANALDFINNLPKGLDTTVGDKGIRLSGGQRQRIAIARALLKDAPVLILDEATSALDSESERTVQEALERLRAGRTTLVIAHRLSTIERADRILVLEAGRVVESGAHAELLAAGGLYADLYRIQYAQLPARELVSEGASHDGL
jgi:subfamily B ATP-binding cassette protein MsbA